MNSFLDALNDRVLVCDGAMGTMLYSKGVFINKSFDAMNLTQAPLVDVSSGVESAPGVEDVDKIAAFCEAVSAC